MDSRRLLSLLFLPPLITARPDLIPTNGWSCHVRSCVAGPINDVIDITVEQKSRFCLAGTGVALRSVGGLLGHLRWRRRFPFARGHQAHVRIDPSYSGDIRSQGTSSQFSPTGIRGPCRGRFQVKTMWNIWTAGLMTGLALIFAIGAQNAFVLRQGLHREHVGVVVGLCIASDSILILGGTFGIGALLSGVPAALIVLKWGGVGYLGWWAVRSFAASLKPSSLIAEAPRSRGPVVMTTLAVTYLNPNVYLDTVVLLGGLANQYGSDARWVFAAGAVAGSAVWFPALGYGARALSGVLSSPHTWRVVDLATSAMMLFFAINLLLSDPTASRNAPLG
jgi:L-lysine exporter family protein LysE/ArgO